MFKAQSLKFRVWGLGFEGYEFDKAMLKSREVSNRFCLTCLGALWSTLVTACTLETLFDSRVEEKKRE